MPYPQTLDICALIKISFRNPENYADPDIPQMNNNANTKISLIYRPMCAGTERADICNMKKTSTN